MRGRGWKARLLLALATATCMFAGTVAAKADADNATVARPDSSQEIVTSRRAAKELMARAHIRLSSREYALADALFVELGQRFGKSSDPMLRKEVETAARARLALAKSLLAKARARESDKDFAGAMSFYNEFEALYAQETGRDLVALVQSAAWSRRSLEGRGLLRIGLDMVRAHDLELALATFDEIDRRFPYDSTLPLRALKAQALYAKGLALEQARRLTPALHAYNETLRLHGFDTQPRVVEWTAKALCAKASLQCALGHIETGITIYEEIIRRFEFTPAAQDVFIEALVRAAAARARLGDTKIALALHDTLESRFGKDASPFFRELTANNQLAKARILADVRAPEQALMALDALLSRLDADPTPALRETAHSALVLKRALHWDNGEYRQALAASLRLARLRVAD